MKNLARAILRWAVTAFPPQQREYGQAMLAELEELRGWAALEWALGGMLMAARQGHLQIPLRTFWLCLALWAVLMAAIDFQWVAYTNADLFVKNTWRICMGLSGFGVAWLIRRDRMLLTTLILSTVLLFGFGIQASNILQSFGRGCDHNVSTFIDGKRYLWCLASETALDAWHTQTEDEWRRTGIVMDDQAATYPILTFAAFGLIAIGTGTLVAHTIRRPNKPQP